MKTQGKDLQLQRITVIMKNGKSPGFVNQEDGTLRFQGRLCVINDENLKQFYFTESHNALYSIHPRGNKLYKYKYLRQVYWWRNIKQEVGYFVAKCLTCQRINIEHQRPDVCCNLSMCQNGNMILYPWTLSWACQAQLKE